MAFWTILNTFVCAVFGAIFGFILGSIIEIIPGVGAVALNGASLPALLAALGLIAGALMGLIISVLAFYAWKNKYAKYKDYWARTRSYWHGYRHYGRHWHYHGPHMQPLSDPVENSLEEIDGYLSYLEDMPKDRLSGHDEKLARLNERLSRLKASMGESN